MKDKYEVLINADNTWSIYKNHDFAATGYLDNDSNTVVTDSPLIKEELALLLIEDALN